MASGNAELFLAQSIPSILHLIYPARLIAEKKGDLSRRSITKIKSYVYGPQKPFIVLYQHTDAWHLAESFLCLCWGSTAVPVNIQDITQQSVTYAPHQLQLF